jgi:hypothetical protein
MPMWTMKEEPVARMKIKRPPNSLKRTTGLAQNHVSTEDLKSQVFSINKRSGGQGGGIDLYAEKSK